MLLSRDKILKHKKEGNIIIDPFEPRNLKTVSYDVTLGDWYWREKAPAGRSTIHNIYDEKSTRKVWDGPFKSISVPDISAELGVDLKNIKTTDRIILLGPGETVLRHTIEFIGGRNICVAKMYARSSLGRNFIEVCKDAGWGDIGYFNRWTMEITNISQYFSIPLVVGRRIAQMVFYETAPLSNSSNGADYALDSGKYQTESDLDKLIKSWNPEMMIPRLHLDREVTDEG